MSASQGGNRIYNYFLNTVAYQEQPIRSNKAKKSEPNSSPDSDETKAVYRDDEEEISKRPRSRLLHRSERDARSIFRLLPCAQAMTMVNEKPVDTGAMLRRIHKLSGGSRPHKLRRSRPPSSVFTAFVPIVECSIDHSTITSSPMKQSQQPGARVRNGGSRARPANNHTQWIVPDGLP
ncbi:unnamed protein product [Pleuronectes platessa]|uniref:Uncharacterized protein n=1 Tax=Pleuronectes platessa TaxID=8262 RepID=A0A9N7V3Y8_PLEPL|nr:unnamed protein product [Pleuronectes platessa]